MGNEVLSCRTVCTQGLQPIRGPAVECCKASNPWYWDGASSLSPSPTLTLFSHSLSLPHTPPARNMSASLNAWASLSLGRRPVLRGNIAPPCVLAIFNFPFEN